MIKEKNFLHLENKKSDHRTNALLFFIDNEILFFHINVKQLYRIFISLSSIAYIIYYANKDLLNCLIVPSGQVPLALMWGLHGKTKNLRIIKNNILFISYLVLHLLGLAIYVCLTACFNWNKSSQAMKQIRFHPRSHFSGLIIIFILILIPIIFQIISIFLHILCGMLAFILWTFLFHQTWIPPETESESAPAHEDTNDRTRTGKQ